MRNNYSWSEKVVKTVIMPSFAKYEGKIDDLHIKTFEEIAKVEEEMRSLITRWLQKSPQAKKADFPKDINQSAQNAAKPLTDQVPAKLDESVTKAMASLKKSD